jgi:hypothetical protein
MGKFNFSFTATLITAPFTTGKHPLQDAEGQEKALNTVARRRCGAMGVEAVA